MAGKNEVALEFNAPASSSSANGKSNESRPVDELVEMRFYIPRRERDPDASDDEDEEEREVEVDEEGNEITPAESFHKAITERAEIGESAGDAIVTFGEVLVVTPRGRFDIEMHSDHLRLHGKTYDYRVLYSSVHRQFLLPKLDGVHRQLVVGLDPPLRQGQTKYPWLVMQWDETEEVDVTLNIEDDVLQSKYKGLIKKEYSDPTYIVVSQLFRHLIGKEMTPPADNYRSVSGDAGIKCNVKAVQGELYFLAQSLLFIAKQPINLDFRHMVKVTLSRVGGAMRTCDITIEMDSGAEVAFTSVNKDELEGVKNFLKSKSVRVKELTDETAMRDLDAMDLGEDEDDESEDEDASRRPKGKSVPGKSGGAPAAAANDDDSEEDEDFAAESSDDGSATDSDSEADSENDVAPDDMMEELGKKATKGTKKAKASEKAAEKDDEMDVDVDVDEDDQGKAPKQKKQRTE